MAFPAIAYILIRKKGRRELLPYAKTLIIAVALPYLCAGLLAVHPASFAELKLWLLGSAALGNDRAFSWHAAPLLHVVPSWLGMSLRIFTEFAGRRGFAWSAGLILALLPLVAAARGAVEKTREAIFWLIWLAGYALLFLSWEPGTVVYRITDLLALWALATLGLQAMPGRWRLGALAAWTAAAFAFNLSFVVRPASAFDNNPDLVDAAWTKSSTPDNAWVLAADRGAVFIPYFAGRRPVNLRYYPDEAALYAKLDALAKAGEAAYVSGRTLEKEGLRAALERYGLKPVMSAPDLSMFRVTRRK
jgi:hypothetical protein